MDAKRRALEQPVGFSKYLLLDRIGAGGMAEIFRARTFGSHGFGKELAIKKLLPHLNDDQEFVALFINEAKIAGSLQHANIAQVLDLGELQGQCFIAMEYVHGKDLHDLLARCAGDGLQLPVKLALFVAMEVLKGLEHAHKARQLDGTPLGLIHRDMSPSNVLLSYAGDVKVTDFGIAQAASINTLPDMAPLKGKVGYMAPEQICGNPVDHRADLFSCGIVLYEMLTLRRLFVGKSELEVMLQIRDGKIAAALPAAAKLPSELRDILATALAWRPEDRFQTASDLHHVLLDYMFRHDIRATSEHLQRFLSRLFSREMTEENARRLCDPVNPDAFPDVRSPQVARYRLREPTGQILGPMSLDTLLTLLRHQSTQGATVSIDLGPWLPPEEHDTLLPTPTEPPAPTPNLARAPAPPDSGTLFGQRPQGLSTDPTLHSRFERSHTHTHVDPPEEHLRDALAELPHTGDLRELPFALLLHHLHRSRTTGAAIIRSEQHRKVVFVRDGMPYHIETDRPSELLGNFLLQHGVLTREQLRDAIKDLAVFEGRFGDLLIVRGYLHSHALFHYLSLQAREKLLDLFSWEDGTFELEGGREFKGEVIPLGIDPQEILIEGVRRRMPLSTIEATFHRLGDCQVRVDKQRLMGLNALRLTTAELRIAADLHTDSTLRALLQRLPEEASGAREQAMRVLFALVITRLVTLL